MATLKRPQIGIIFIVFILVIIILLLRTNSSSFGYNSSGYIVNIGTERMDVFCRPALNPLSQTQNNTNEHPGQQIQLYNDKSEKYWYYCYGSSTAHFISQDKNNPSTITLNGTGWGKAYLYIFNNTKRQTDYNNQSLLIYLDGWQDFAMKNDSQFLSRSRSVGLIPDGTVYKYGVSTTTYGYITLYKTLTSQWDNFYKNAMFQAYSIPRRGNSPLLANHLNKQDTRTAGDYNYSLKDDAPENSIAFVGDSLRIVNSTLKQQRTTNYLYYT